MAAAAFAMLIANSSLGPDYEHLLHTSIGPLIPVGQSFEESGAAALAAQWLGGVLAGQPLFLVLVALCSVTLLLSIFLNNVTTAIIMGPMAIAVARLLGVSPDAALLAALIGASSDFLTPIWPSEQSAGHGTGRLQIHRLCANGSAACHCRHSDIGGSPEHL